MFDDGAFLVNQRGERFVDETSWPEREIAVAAQPDKLAYILLDGRLFRSNSATRSRRRDEDWNDLSSDHKRKHENQHEQDWVRGPRSTVDLLS